MSNIFDVLDEPMPKSIPNDPDLNWRPWHGQVKPVVGWDAYAVKAEELARSSSSPNAVRAAHGLPLSSDDAKVIPCPCDRCQRARLEVVAVCEAHTARKQAALHHSDALADMPRRRWEPVAIAAGIFMALWFGHALLVELGHALFNF